MKIRSIVLSGLLCGLTCAVSAATLTVTTANSSGAGSLAAALGAVQAGDTITFNIPGDGPHTIAPPPGGFPLITADNVTLDGYTQPGSSPNSNGILAPNNAQIRIILDARNENTRLMDFPGDSPNDQTGYGDTESAVLGILSATNVTIRGFSILSAPLVGGGAVAAYGVSFAKGASGRVSGCWIGIHPDGQTLAGPADGITGFRYRVRDENNTVLRDILINDVVVGVPVGAANPQAEFNVLCGIPAIPIIIEGQGTRICGNFFNVFPDGVRDYNPALDGLLDTFEGNIEIGRAGNNTVIGVDGDGVNDEHERNVLSGVVPPGVLGGYDHNIEFYGQTPGTNIVIAGNYIGIGIDGATRFTNGVPALNAAGGSAEYRFGSNRDGISDDLEANHVYNNWPPDLFPGFEFGNALGLNFFDELATSGTVNARGNVLVNNVVFPASPLRNGGQFLLDYYARALVDTSAGLVPTIAETSNGQRLRGTVPVTNPDYPITIIDVYVADPEGIVTGREAGIPELPDGFVQGRRFVASFVEGSVADMDNAPGRFDFDISGLGGGNLTITANYSRDPAGTPNPRLLTSPFSAPRAIPFVPGNAESAGLARLVPDRVIFDAAAPNLNNWEPYAGVIGTSTFVVEANTFADDGLLSNQRYALAFQPVAGGNAVLGEGFFADNGTPYTGPINLSRQDGNPGRVAGDRRPGAVNFIVGAEASPHGFPPFGSDNRWSLGWAYGPDDRYGTIQMFALNPSTLAQSPLSKALDSANGRLTTGAPPGNQVTRFGGDVAVLDNGNVVSVVEDRSNVRNPSGNAAVATIFAPDGTVVKESFLVANGDIWSNLASYRGGFCVRASGVLYFFDNGGNPQGSVNQSTSGSDFDAGRGDGTRIAAHINSPYVFLAGRGRGGATAPIRVAAWDARDRSFIALAEVSEPGLLDASSDRVNLAVDALNRVAVAYETKIRQEQEQNQTLLRVLSLNVAGRRFDPLTPSVFAFVNNGDAGFRTIRPTLAMTTRQILIAAKGEINKANNVSAGPDSQQQTTFYTVLAHPAPQDDPTPGAGGGANIAIARDGANLRITYTGALESTASIAPANWQPVAGASSPYVIAPAQQTGNRFYRSRQ